jgi:hypothetical protein
MQGEKMKPISMTPSQHVLNSIEKVLIVESMYPNEPKIWNFYINGKILQIKHYDLENLRKFRESYLKALNSPLPQITQDEWHALLSELCKDNDRIFVREEGSKTSQ